MWWKLVSPEVCRADADPPLVQLLCPVPTRRPQHGSVSVIGGVIELGEIFTVCCEVFMPL